MSFKRKVKYLVEVDRLDADANIIMTANDLRDMFEDLLRLENLRCVQYYLDGMSMQKYLEAGKEIKRKLDDVLNV